jgi:hypothetical protein
MPGPYIIRDLALLQSLNKTDAVVADPDYGVQCVGLVKYYAVDDAGNKCPATKEWAEGASVRSAIASCIAKAEDGIQRGTAIATFKDGKYPNHASGNHACFFIETQKDGSGFLVLEQHVKPFPDKIPMRVITYKGVPKDGKIQSDNGDCYSVIL